MVPSLPSPSIFTQLEAALAAGDLVTQATVVSGGTSTGAKMLVFDDGRTVGSLGSANLDEQVREAATATMASPRGQLAWVTEYDTRCGAEPFRVFIEVFTPPPHLVIFGGVHIALPLVAYAKILGFRVTVADPRSAFANRERFPEVDTIIEEWPQEAVERVAIGPSTYCVILTHDPKIDQPALRSVIGQNPAYVGAIGSRQTHVERFERMKNEGVSPEALAQVYSPIGLDLNAQTPEEIALAIIAEIVAVRRGGRGGFLKSHTG